MRKGIFLLVTLLFLFFVPAVKAVNSVDWQTPYSSFSANDFYIRIGDKQFYGERVVVTGDPSLQKPTLEMTWQENGVQMRLYIYFEKATENTWRIYDVRTYNGDQNPDWISYKPYSVSEVTAPLGYPFKADQLTFRPTDSSDAEIVCARCSLTSFKTNEVPISEFGFGLDFLIGLPKGQIIKLTTNPLAGYGVNAVMVNKRGDLVEDQGKYTFSFEPQDAIVNVVSKAIIYQDGSCIYNLLPPCPKTNIQLSGLNPGNTRIIGVVTNENGEVLAKNSFPVVVVDSSTATGTEERTPLTDNDDMLILNTEQTGLIEHQEVERPVFRRIWNSIVNYFQGFINRGLSR